MMGAAPNRCKGQQGNANPAVAHHSIHRIPILAPIYDAILAPIYDAILAPIYDVIRPPRCLLGLLALQIFVACQRHRISMWRVGENMSIHTKYTRA